MICVPSRYCSRFNQSAPKINGCRRQWTSPGLLQTPPSTATPGLSAEVRTSAVSILLYLVPFEGRVKRLLRSTTYSKDSISDASWPDCHSAQQRRTSKEGSINKGIIGSAAMHTSSKAFASPIQHVGMTWEPFLAHAGRRPVRRQPCRATW